ncbi:MAG: hypothetical protein M3442_13920 [Chloroflexota bacterium]|nr:hypothetical protein [Chloroflexota bacterium]
MLSLDGIPGANVPRPEHPRPDLQRTHWINLNGRWRFCFDPHNRGEQQRSYRVTHPAVAARIGEVISTVEDPFVTEIVVPFPWESRLSGIGDPNYKGAAWYQRMIEAPREWADDPDARPTTTWRLRPYLCFGAVDWNAKVWVNGRFVAEHDGGYTPFAVDLSPHLRPGMPATLTVRVWDACDADVPLGKQIDEWYTHSSGIWQTVWLEGRPDAYLSQVHVTPHLEAGRATFAVGVVTAANAGPGLYRLEIDATDASFPSVERTIDVQLGQTDAILEVDVPDPHPWSPEDPHLYDCVLTLTPEISEGQGQGEGESSKRIAEEDRVQTYFGLRTITSARWEGKPYEYVFLNGEPVFLRGVLDQAFHPEGVYSYPSDEAVRADVQAAKDLGLNMLRCHIKVNEPRYYYWADKLGLLVMYDLPSAGVYTPSARANWERTFRDALARDYSHPCIFAWILFNETWGLEEHQRPEGWTWVKEMFYLTKSLDPTRLVEDNSPYLYDHVTTDINSWHFYIGDYDRARRHVENVVTQSFEGSPYHYVGGVYADVQGADAYRQGTQPLLNSEYAGISAWGGDRDISYSFKFLTGELRRHDMLCGYVYTELTDVEWEHNGLLNYDRTAKAFGYDGFVPGMGVADLTGADFVGLDCPPCQTLPPGAAFRATPFVAHWAPRPLAGATLRWRVSAIDRFGEARAMDEGHQAVAPRRYGVTVVAPIEARVPDEPGLATIALWLEDGDGTVRARNYVNVDVYRSRVDHAVEHTEAGLILRFVPGDFIGSSWLDPRIGPRGSKFGATGAGWVDYAIGLPDDYDLRRATGIRLLFEAGARTAHARLDWRDSRHMQLGDYPQTETRKVPSDVAVWVNGVRIGMVHLPDDPADARGVLSLHNSDYWEAGSYGFLTTLEADPALTRRIVDNAQGGRLIIRFEVPQGGGAGGLNLYGARMGAFPVAPTVLITS